MLTWLTLGFIALVTGTPFSAQESVTGWELSSSAYCDSGLATWNCTACGRSGVFLKSVKVIEDVANRAIVGYDAQKNNVVVVFRGSYKIQNFLQDANDVLVDYPKCDGCQVHEGFILVFRRIKEAVRTAVYNLMMQHPGASLRVYGHSLGGALAVICAADLMTWKGIQPEFVYTYGQPRVGNRAFSEWYDSLIKAHFRVTNGADVVPRLPSMESGYHHVNTEVHYTNADAFKVCDNSGEDPTCNLQYPFLQTYVADHLNALGSRCCCRDPVPHSEDYYALKKAVEGVINNV